MAANISDVLREVGHPGYAIDVAELENLVEALRGERDRYQTALELITAQKDPYSMYDIAATALNSPKNNFSPPLAMDQI